MKAYASAGRVSHIEAGAAARSGRQGILLVGSAMSAGSGHSCDFFAWAGCGGYSHSERGANAGYTSWSTARVKGGSQ